MDTAASYSSLEPTSKTGRKQQYWKLQELVSRMQSSGKQQQQEHLHWQVATPAAMEQTLKAGSYIPVLIEVLKKKTSKTILESLQLCKIPPCRVGYI